MEVDDIAAAEHDDVGTGAVGLSDPGPGGSTNGGPQKWLGYNGKS